MAAEEVNDITSIFYQEFTPLRMVVQADGFNLPWYKVTEQAVLMWLQDRSGSARPANKAHPPPAPPLFHEEDAPISPLFGTDEYIISGFESAKKKKVMDEMQD